MRQFWVKDRVDREEAKIVHKETSELLTKPLQGWPVEDDRRRKLVVRAESQGSRGLSRQRRKF
jgi:hypothetical protein